MSSSPVEGAVGTWSHCGKQTAHPPHLHSFAMNEGPYTDVQCLGTSMEQDREYRSMKKRVSELENELRTRLREQESVDRVSLTNEQDEALRDVQRATEAYRAAQKRYYSACFTLREFDRQETIRTLRSELYDS